MQKVNPTRKKERKQQKGEVKGNGQKAVFKIEKGKAQNVSKAKERAKGQKQYKKGKKTAVETNRHCEKRRLPPKDSE